MVCYPVLCVCCDYFALWSLASSLFTGAELSLWCRPCSRWLRWRFSAWRTLVQLETAVALLQWLFWPGACTRTNHVFATMRSLQCNQCQDSMRQINPNGFQSLRYSMYNYAFVAINIFELSWVELNKIVLPRDVESNIRHKDFRTKSFNSKCAYIVFFFYCIGIWYLLESRVLPRPVLPIKHIFP